MRRVLIYPVLCLSLALGAACSRGDGDTTANQTASGDTSRGDQIEVTGCLTSNPENNQFVLTANASALTSLTNRAGAGEAETFHYQLVGGTDLASYVGRELIVTGRVTDDGKDVNLEGEDQSEDVATKSRGEDATPAVESSHEVEMQVERLDVASITPTGSACQIGQGQRR
jgi:hypothetical protein